MSKLFLVLFFNVCTIPRDFYHRETKCAFSYSILKEWHLKLHDNEGFNLFVTVKDTRFKKPLIDTLTGKWYVLHDTLRLKVDRNGIYPTSIAYVLNKDELTRVGFNALLPDVMKVGNAQIER